MINKLSALGIFFSLMLSACSSSVLGPNYGPTLADLPSQTIPEDAMPVPITDLDRIEDSYRSALEVAEDPDLRHRILVRLADIEMSRSENEQVDVAEEKQFFNDAIGMYEKLLKVNSQRAGIAGVAANERLLYQLSKAYALDGRIDESNAMLDKLVTNFPESAFKAEADFRQAELAFNSQQYAESEALYARVMAAGDDTPFYTNAVYMHGWSRFKRARYRAAIPSFTEVLDRTFQGGKNFDGLSNSKKNLAKDTLRVMSMIFSYLDGPESITEVYTSLGERDYQYMLYANLGELYYEKDRFRDAAETYLHYVKKFPNTEHGPAFSVKSIDMYSQGNFPSLILPAKETFVQNYGVYSEFFKARDDEQKGQLLPYLKTYLIELSSFYHAEAQAADQALVKYNAARAAGKKPKVKPEEALPNYLRAADYYGEFVFTFPKDPQTAEMTFLKAEALYSARRLPDAVESFELVAYQYIDAKRGAESGYSAIIIMTELMDNMRQSLERSGFDEAQINTDVKLLEWNEHKIISSISFSDYYPTDKRAVPILTTAAQDLFTNDELPRAIITAERLVNWQPTPKVELQKTAWTILSHSRFELKQYVEAEVAYRKLLTLMEPEDKDRDQVIERIAASSYRQAEALVAAGDKAGAISRMLDIRNIAPNSDVAISGQYDAIAFLIELKQWALAETELLDFKGRYPQHDLSATLASKFALVYQETEQWAKAAAVLAEMSKSGDPETRRTSLYLSAELFERSGDKNAAIDKYRDYINEYPQPFGIATEARAHMVELYDQTKQWDKKDYWLNKLIEADAKAGDARTARSKSLAAMAMAKFADDSYQEFVKIKLTLPVKKSMKKKKSAMDKAMGQYKKIIGFGIAQYATQANHRIAEIYVALSRDLMDSERPNGLDELALEQYEILLEEQAFPFEEKAIGIYEGNTKLTHKGIYDDWVKESFKSLSKLLPARYGKTEHTLEVSDELY